jgi:hypothetical protein
MCQMMVASLRITATRAMVSPSAIDAFEPHP